MAVLKLRESGFIEDLYKKWYYDMGACNSATSDLGDDQSTLYIADMAGKKRKRLAKLIEKACFICC